MAKIPLNPNDEEIELLRDVLRGLADAEADRVTPHAEARTRLLARYFK